jgi:hypothetical protein
LRPYITSEDVFFHSNPLKAQHDQKHSTPASIIQPLITLPMHSDADPMNVMCS